MTKVIEGTVSPQNPLMQLSMAEAVLWAGFYVQPHACLLPTTPGTKSDRKGVVEDRPVV